MRLPNFSSAWVWWLLIGLTTVWLLAVTLRPDRVIPTNDLNLTPMAEHGGALACLVKSSCLFQRRAFRFLLIDVVGNIIVFMPLGFGLVGAFQPANLRQTLWLAALAGFSLSLLIELIQLTIPSRTTDVDDLIFNTLGAILGALCFVWLKAASSKAAGRRSRSSKLL